MTNPPIASEQARHNIESAMQSLLDPDSDIAALRDFFTEDYVQWVDGVELDMAGFMQHAQQLKSTLLKGEFHILKLMVSGDSAADIHDVIAFKKDGQKVHARVIAFFHFRAGKIYAVEEMTHLLQGSAEDKDLGSRV